MLTYQDKTFCPGHGCADYITCARALTEDVRAKAKKAGLPISQYVEPMKLDCYEPQTEEPGL